MVRVVLLQVSSYILISIETLKINIPSARSKGIVAGY